MKKTQNAVVLLLMPALVWFLQAGTAAFSQDLRTLRDLRGDWKFELGDDSTRAHPAFDDRAWATVKVPSTWEDQGFPGYDGYAWYRISFTAPADWQGRRLYLELGFIDDVDEVYLNGTWIGFRGSFPPNYITAYSDFRRYPIPDRVVVAGGKNVIAVRVYDNELGGGIVSGNVRIAVDASPLVVQQSLETNWKFQIGDDLSWKSLQFDDRRWRSVRVPAPWETQGYRNYDGWGWYRLTFQPMAGLTQKRLVLFLGRIDDNDEVYLNGERIGRTGRFPQGRDPEGGFNDYLEWRAYTIPTGKILDGKANVIAVRVYDRFLHGGIYEGPVGLVLREDYLTWNSRTNKKGNDDGWEKLLDWLFK